MKPKKIPNIDQYRSPVVLWYSYWKENGTMEITTRSGERKTVPAYSLYGVPNKEYGRGR